MIFRFENGAAVAPPACRRLFTIEQAAHHSRVPSQMIRLWISAGKLEVIRLDDGQIRVDEVDLARLLSSAPKRP